MFNWHEKKHVGYFMASNKELVLMAMLLLEEDDVDNKGHYSQLLSDLAAHDTPGFQNFMRMNFPYKSSINRSESKRNSAIE